MAYWKIHNPNRNCRIMIHCIIQPTTAIQLVYKFVQCSWKYLVVIILTVLLNAVGKVKLIGW